MARRRRPRQLLAQRFDEAIQPVFLIESRRIAYVNAACATWLGVPEDELIGTECYFGAPSPQMNSNERAALLLCPPPELLDRPCFRTFQLAIRTGEVKYACGVSFHSEGNKELSVWVYVGDEQADSIGDKLKERESEASRLHARLRQYQSTGDLTIPPALLGDSFLAQRASQQVAIVSQRPGCVLLQGPAGIGREQVARFVHDSAASHRGLEQVPMFPIACPLMDAELIDSSLELFGHQSRDALLASVVLMDVDQLIAEAQDVLAKFLDDQRGRSVYVFSTSRSSLISNAVGFDANLALRLSTITIELPSLASRREDIPLIIQQLVEMQNVSSERQIEGFSSNAIDRMVGYDWPENTAELAELVAAALQENTDRMVDARELPDLLSHAEEAARRPQSKVETVAMDEFLEEVEKELLQRALAVAKGNKAQAARMLGISRQRVIRRVSQWDLDWSPGD